MAFTLWFTGLPGSGKSVIAKRVRNKYKENYHRDITILRLDKIRKIITPEPNYSNDERNIVYRSLYLVAKILNEHKHNIDVIIDATANREIWRAEARKLIPNFAEVYIKCPVEICIEREKQRHDGVTPEDIYEKAKSGALVPGINVPYEEPVTPEVVVDSDKLDIEESAEKIMEFIKIHLKNDENK